MEEYFKEAHKGRLAKETLEYLSDVFKIMKEELYERWRKTDDMEEWKKIKISIDLINKLESIILSDIGAGEIANKYIEEAIKYGNK